MNDIKETMDKSVTKTEPNDTSKTEKQATRKKSRDQIPGTLEYERKKEEEEHEIIFKWHELEGGTLSFGLRKYKGPIEQYNLVDGQRYTLPLRVIRHINSLGTPIYQTKVLPNKKTVQEFVRYKNRCTCESASFVGLNSMNKFKETKQTPSIL